MNTPPDIAEFIRQNLRLTPVPAVPEISIYTAHPGTGLRHLLETQGGDSQARPPYWAYPWAGGAALARHFLDHRETLAGCAVLDLGAGSGLVAIAAAKAGARQVLAAEIDPNGIVALGLNAAANGMAVTAIAEDVTMAPPPSVDLIAVGDLFYAPELAGRVTAYLDACLGAGIEVLVGDPGRAWLPHARLTPVAAYQVPDFGGTGGAAPKPAMVYSFGPGW